MSNVMLIAMAEAKRPVAQATTVEDKLRAAMTACKDHWMCVDENDQFRAAVAAVLNDDAVSAEDRERIKLEVRALSTLNAAAMGVPVDMSQLDFPEKPLGIVAMWKELNKG